MDALETLDQAVFRCFQDHQMPALDAVMVNLTDLGNHYLVTGVAVLAALVFLALRRPRAALLVVVAGLSCWAFVETVKRTVKRPRPVGIHRLEPSLLSRILTPGSQRATGDLPPAMPSEKSYSFPSGHTFSSAAVYLTVALLAARRLRRPWPRVVLVVGTALLVFAIGVTRLYVGAHYLSDVVAGWAGGLGVALLCAWLDERWAAPHEARRSAEQGPVAPVRDGGPPPAHGLANSLSSSFSSGLYSVVSCSMKVLPSRLTASFIGRFTPSTSL
jgi:undecaprenyl-diphosphatase